MSEQFTSKRANKLRADLEYNPIDKPSSLKKRFKNVSQNDQFEEAKNGMSKAEEAAAYKGWGEQLARQAKEREEAAAQNAVTKGGISRKMKTIRKRKRNSKKRKTLRKRNSQKRWRY